MSAPIVIGLGFGDEGKGTIVDYLVRERSAEAVVRFNGGPQAAHNVVLTDGTHHTFAQFGSGTLAGARTVLSKHVLVNPESLALEAEALAVLLGENALEQVVIDERAKIITPWHVALNQMRERSRWLSTNDNRHGSCGKGIGETVQDALNGHALLALDLRVGNLPALLLDVRNRLREQAAKFKTADPVNWHLFSDRDALDLTVDTYHRVAQSVTISPMIRMPRNAVYEGAQGILLDENHGFAPFNTWSDCTAMNARELLGDYGEVIGVTRTYGTRHGPGPFPGEWYGPDANTLHKRFPPEMHNGHNEWQGEWRTGALDLPLLRYALDRQDVDSIALTHCDIQPAFVVWAHHYEDGSQITDYDFDVTPDAHTLFKAKPVLLPVGSSAQVQDLLPARVSIRSYGPTAEQKATLALA